MNFPSILSSGTGLRSLSPAIPSDVWPADHRPVCILRRIWSARQSAELADNYHAFWQRQFGELLSSEVIAIIDFYTEVCLALGQKFLKIIPHERIKIGEWTQILYNSYET